jgi:uncharacterized protein
MTVNRCAVRTRRAIGVAAGVLMLVAAAWSCAQVPPISGRVSVAVPGVTVPRPAPILQVPTPGELVPSRRARLTAAPPPPALAGETPLDPAAPVVQAPPAPTGPRPLIALVLPLEAPAYARAAEAVRAGFFAAAEIAGVSRQCLVIAHNEDGVIAAFQAAEQSGARVIVGPLVRDDVKTLAISGLPLRPTIMLNQLDEGTRLPPNAYSLALTIEGDARVLARRALADGVRAIDVVGGDAPLMRRMAISFTSEWTAGGGAPPGDYRFEASTEALTGLRKSLIKAFPDAVLLAVDGQQAALAKPFIGNIMVYTSGLLVERPPDATARDLNDVRVVDIPWIVTPDAPELAQLPRREFGNQALERLYALGLDAFRVARAFTAEVPERLEFDGATGHISLNDQRQFVREGRLAIYRDGHLLPLDTH